ncbi:MAG: D-alanyl-D-alanine carboxypeptidase/D-alanyl-D-alanine-endopeptidase [Candidatus Delongbacteria bacterium]
MSPEGRPVQMFRVTDVDISELPKEFSVLQDPRSGVWSVSFYDLDSKLTLFAYNPNKNLLPASNLKLLTTAAALKILGAEYRFSTEFYADGYVDRKLNLLKGNLYIRGDGDPTIGRNYLKNGELSEFRPVVDSLRMIHGIDYIEGSLIPFYPFEREKGFGKGWDIDDISSYYSAVISPLVFHENLTKVTIRNGIIRVVPDYDFAFRLDTVRNLKKPDFIRIMGSDSLIIRSDFESTVSGYVTVNDPDKFFISNLKKFLEKNNIRVQDRITKADPRSILKLMSLKSDSLYKLIEKCNSESNNLYAEQIFRKTAEVFYNDSSLSDIYETDTHYPDYTQINSELYERMFGINDFNLADGSGLSRMNFFSSSKFIKVLDTMYEDENFLTYLSSLPLPGSNGTLRYRIDNQELHKRLFAKTGSMTGVNCLSGYLYTKNGNRIAFSILNNYYNFGRGITYNIFEDMLLYFVNNY